MCVKSASNSKIYCIFAAESSNKRYMIQVVLRSSKADTGTLAVRVVNRNVGMNTFISMHLKMKCKDWSEASQLPKNIYDGRAVKELNGMSYAQLAELILDVKKLLVALDDANAITSQTVKSIIKDAINKALIGEVIEENVQPQRVKPTFVEFIEQYVHECENGERLKQKSSHKIAYGTLKGLRSFLARMKQYEQARKRVIDWDDLDLNFYNDFKQYYLEQKYSPNTIAGFIKKMKTILFAAKDLNLTTRDDFMSRKWFVGFEMVENIYIPEKRLKQMYSLDIADVEDMVKRACRYAKDKDEERKVLEQVGKPVLLKHLAEARDIFLMGCLTGQRVSDYKRISTSMIETIKGDRKFLHLIQTKTGKDVYVPYNEMMSKILERYDGTMPMMCDQHLNRKIKVVGLLLGWTEPAGLTERRGVMEYKSDKRFCDAIMTHTARRTFATNAYKAGVPLSAIMAVTGHSSEDMLRRYLKLNTKERALLAAAEFDKVKSAL